MIHFIECLQKGEKPVCTEIDGKLALEIAVAATDHLKLEKRFI